MCLRVLDRGNCIVHTALSKSNSDHLASLNSLGLCATLIYRNTPYTLALNVCLIFKWVEGASVRFLTASHSSAIF